jgi:hypothetical protein
LSRTEKPVKEIARRINKQVYTSEGKFFLVACMNFPKVNSMKTKYMVMARGRNAGQNHKKICNTFFERVESFKFWEKA